MELAIPDLLILDVLCLWGEQVQLDNWPYKSKRQTKESQDAPDEAS